MVYKKVTNTVTAILVKTLHFNLPVAEYLRRLSDGRHLGPGVETLFTENLSFSSPHASVTVMETPPAGEMFDRPVYRPAIREQMQMVRQASLTAFSLPQAILVGYYLLDKHGMILLCLEDDLHQNDLIIREKKLCFHPHGMRHPYEPATKFLVAQIK